MATSARKTAAARRKPVDDIPMPEIDVIEINSSDADQIEPELVPIFKVDGTMYCIDRARGAGVVLRFMKDIQTKGQETAVGGLLLDLLGEEAYDALTNCKGVTMQQLTQVSLACVKALLGDQEQGPKA